MSILVTAFGPFAGRSENASSRVLVTLRKMVPEIRTRVLPVDAVLAPSRLKEAIRRIRPSAVIMLGEAAGSTGIRLEMTAWNLKDFRIPDNAGRMPTAVPVRRGAVDSIPSTLPSREIGERLSGMDCGFSFSDDAGRYLCNQLFYTALDFLEMNGLKIPAGFMHLPLERDLPTARAAEAIGEVIRIVSNRKAVKS